MAHRFMPLLQRALSPHTLNYLVVGVLTVGPLLAYASLRSPSAEQLEAELRETRGDALARSARATERVNAFWRTKRAAPEMDAVYEQLLHGGKGAWRRQYELGGGSALAAAEAAESPAHARMQRLLALPLTDEERRREAEAAEAAAAAAAAAAATVAAGTAAGTAAGMAAAAPTAAAAAVAAAVPAAAATAAAEAVGSDADLRPARRSWLPF